MHKDVSQWRYLYEIVGGFAVLADEIGHFTLQLLNVAWIADHIWILEESAALVEEEGAEKAQPV